MRLPLVLALVVAPTVALAADPAEDRYGPPPPVLRPATPAPLSYPTHASARAASTALAPQASGYNGRFLTWSSKAGLRGPQGEPAPGRPAPQLAATNRAPAPFLRGPQSAPPAGPAPQSIYDRPAPAPLSYAPPPPRRDPSQDYPYAAQTRAPEPPPKPVRQAYVPPRREAPPAPPAAAPPRQMAAAAPAPRYEAPSPRHEPPAQPVQTAAAPPPRPTPAPPAPPAPVAAAPAQTAAAAPPPNAREPWRNLHSVTGEAPYVPPPQTAAAAPTQPVQTAALPPARARGATVAPAPAAPAPTEVAAAQPAQLTAPAKSRFYSLHRDYGDQPDPIPTPPPRAPVLIGPGDGAAPPEDAPSTPRPAAATAGIY